MALTARFIADKSALSRMRHPAMAGVLEPLILTGDLGTCGIVELEVLYSAISASDLRTTRLQRKAAFPRLPVMDADFEHIAAISPLRAAWIVPKGSLP